MPSHTVKVDRSTCWGNHPAAKVGVSGVDAVRVFSQWVDNEASNEWKAEAIRTLTGKNLACWCKTGAPCHADYLLSWIVEVNGEH